LGRSHAIPKTCEKGPNTTPIRTLVQGSRRP